MTPVNLNFSMDEDKLILTISEDESDLDAKLAEFGRLNFGKNAKFKKLVKNGSAELIPLSDYLLELEEKRSSPEFRELVKRFNLEVEERRALEKRVSAIENQLKVPVSAPASKTVDKKKKKFSRDKYKTNQQPLKKFTEALARGEDKAVRLNSMIELAGYILPTMTAKGNLSYEPHNRARTIMCLNLLSDLQDRYGDAKVQQILNTMAAFSDVQPKIHYIDAIVYCLCEADNPLTPEAFYVAAEQYFMASWQDLVHNVLNEHRSEKNPEAFGRILGRIIMGEAS